jgi:hypothetical protein
MTTLTNHARSPHSPSPIYGIRPGFTVGDLDASRLTALHVYGTYQQGSASPTWNAVTGRWTLVDALTAQASTSDNTGTVISPAARVVKIAANVTGTGSVVLTVKSAVDSYTAVIATYTLTATGGWNGTGHYEYMLGGWASASSDGTSYQATQYGPNTATIGGVLTQGAQEEATTNLNLAADSNYVGQTYNPFQFLSLDGYSLKFFAAVTGTVGYDVNVTSVS